ncbi:MAG: glycosyltransferase family 2 protein [bacterium]
MDLSIIIVSWNVKDKLKQNLHAILASRDLQHNLGLKGFSYEIYVVDNNSHDNTADMVRHEFPQVKLVANSKNLGFSSAVNQVMREAEGKFILLLNPDMQVKPNTLAAMLEWMNKNSQAGAAICKLINESGELIKHIRRFPSFKDQLVIVLKLPHVFPWILKKYLRYDFNYNHSCQVDSARGSFFLIRKEIIKQVGLLDERYFIWFEDVDYCKTIKEKGLEVWYVSNAECIDFVGQSFKQIKSLTTQKYFRDSMLKYFKKWHSVRQAIILKIAWAIILPFIYLVSILGMKSRAKT